MPNNQIIFSIISLLVGTLLGALVNNVFTLKVKSKVEAADDLYDRLWQLDNLFNTFINCCHRRDGKSGEFTFTNDQITHNQNTANKGQQEKIVEEIKLIREKISLLNTGMHKPYHAILGRKFYDLTKHVEEVVNIVLSDTRYKDNPKLNYKDCFNQLIEYRKKLTSMPYMLTEMFYELVDTIVWIVLKLTFIGIILFLLH